MGDLGKGMARGESFVLLDDSVSFRTRVISVYRDSHYHFAGKSTGNDQTLNAA